MMSINLLDKVQNTIDKFNMADKSERLLVCLSGGADSTALLLCLYKLGYKVTACHIDHCLRGEESDRDRLFCIDLCRKFDIPIEVRRLNVAEYCKENSLSTEEGARILRYKAFGEIECDKICTAHTLSDCLETTIFNLARGSGLKGLASIPPVRDNIIRPLIECTRAEVEDFLKGLGQDFVTDSTNLSDEYSRNKIRHLGIPQLENINFSIMKTYGNSLSFLRSDSDYLEEQAEKVFEESFIDGKYNCELISELHPSIRRRVIMRILQNNGIEISSDKIFDIENIIFYGGKINVKKDIFAVSKNGYLAFKSDFSVSKTVKSAVIVDKMGEYLYQGRTIDFFLDDYSDKIENVHKKFANCCFDYDKIKGEIVLREREAGDKIILCNRNFTSDVRKLVNKLFPSETRSSAVIISDSCGVIFVEGAGAADRVKIDSSTKRILAFSIF